MAEVTAAEKAVAIICLSVLIPVAVFVITAIVGFAFRFAGFPIMCG